MRSYEARKRQRLETVLEAFSAAELAQFVRLLKKFSVALIGSEETLEGLCLRCSAHFDAACPIQHSHDGCPYQKLAAAERRRAAVSES